MQRRRKRVRDDKGIREREKKVMWRGRMEEENDEGRREKEKIVM